MRWTRRARGVRRVGRADALARGAPSGAARGVGRRRRAWQAMRLTSPRCSGERGQAADADARDAWSSAASTPTAADERGAPLRLAGARRRRSTTPLARAGSCTTRRRALRRRRRLARHASPARALELARSRARPRVDAAEPPLLSANVRAERPEIVARRDVRERVARARAVLRAGQRRSRRSRRRLAVLGACDLYAASRTLSAQPALPAPRRRSASYFRHAATALVDAPRARAPRPRRGARPIAPSWIDALPVALHDGWTRCRRASRARCRRPSTAARAGAAFGRTARAASSARGAPLRRADGGDSRSSRDGAPHRARRVGGRRALWPLSSTTHRAACAGLIVAIGGAAPRDVWVPLAQRPAPRWSEVIDRLRAVGTPTRRRRATARGGRVRVVPVAGGAALRAAAPIAGGPASVPALVPRRARSSATACDPSRRRRRGVRRAADAAAAATGDFRRARRSLYQAMRDALRRGDWAAFGAAFDALGARSARRDRLTARAARLAARRRDDADRHRTAVIALGGNALAPSGRAIDHPRPVPAHAREPRRRSSISRSTAGTSASCTATGRRSATSCVRNELARDEATPLPLGVLVAATAGWIGYMIQQSLENALRAARSAAPRGDDHHAGARRPDDPALREPTKFIGHALIAGARARSCEREGHRGEARTAAGSCGASWGARGRIAIHELRVHPDCVEHGTIVDRVRRRRRAGLRAIRRSGWEGIDAVVDKDLAAAVLARDLGAELLLILTDVDAVYADWGTPHAAAARALTVAEAEALDAAGAFGEGSMAPKVRAAVDFVRRTGGRAIITRA